MYNLDYYEKMLREYSASAKDISLKRWWFIQHNIPNAIRGIKVLDYGSGVGWFRAFRPSWAQVWSYDIAEYPQTGIELQTYDVLTLWDVLEHIQNFNAIEPIFRLVDYVAMTIPISYGPLDLSKHFKPGEHFHYFTETTLKALMHRYDFQKIIFDYEVECPPRVDILSAIFKRGSK